MTDAPPLPAANGSALVTPAPPLVYMRICNAMADIAAVPKSQTNSFHKYKFRGIDDMLTMIHPILAKHRLFMVPNIVGDPKVVERATSQGKPELHVVVKVEWRIFTDDGSFVSFTTLGEASDSGDKGSNKAMSASQKYACIQAFSVPVEEKDRDADERSPEFRAPVNTGNLAARLPPAKPPVTIPSRKVEEPAMSPRPEIPEHDAPTVRDADGEPITESGDMESIAGTLITKLDAVKAAKHLANHKAKYKAAYEALRKQRPDLYEEVVAAGQRAKNRVAEEA